MEGIVFTDSHAHLVDVAEGQGAAWRELLARFSAAWSEASPGLLPLLVDVGTEAGDFGRRLGVLGQHPFLRYSLGIWPGEEALREIDESLSALARDLEAAGPGAAAVGECGLDYHHMDGPSEAQRALFEGQLHLARGRGLPVIVHSREAFADTRAILRDSAVGLKVVIHCFGYGPAEAEAFLEDGHFISFAGNLTYKKAEALREAIRIVPEDRLLLETDSPYMNPEPRRGKPCSPLDIGRTYALAAELKGLSVNELACLVAANATGVFGIAWKAPESAESSACGT